MACNVTLAGIVTDCDASLGGIKEVYIAQYADIKSVTVDPESKMISAIEKEASTKWYNYAFRKNTGSLTSTLTVDATAGTNYVANELALVFTKMETSKRIEIAALSVGQLAVIVKDANDKYWYLGKDEYVSASAGTGVTGTAKGDQNAYTITLSCDSITYPYEIDPTKIAEIIA